MSKTAYWEKHLKGRMSIKAFWKAYEVLMGDKEFKMKFGIYFARKLSPRQIEMLNNELIN